MNSTEAPPTISPLAGIRVLDLSRILAGPSCTQMLGDLGADVIKVERPGAGDDTRSWGPPYVRDADGNNSTESAYYLCANRNKRSIAIDITRTKGQELVRDLLQHCDVLVENFKVGGLKKYSLDYASLKDTFPALVYCSITGFGQTGPYAARAGYDFMIQGMGGIMSLTGEADGTPQKVGVAIADIMAGMYATTGILAALRHRDNGGGGQHIDLSLLDAQVGWLMNQATNYLTSGTEPARYGNAHPNIVPYQAFPTADGFVILAVGNDSQFAKFCEFAECAEFTADPRFATNPARVENRDALIPLLNNVMKTKSSKQWLDGLESLGVPCGPINTLSQVFNDPQVRHREMQMSMPHLVAGHGEVDLVANPIRMSETPVTYRLPPPTLAQHSDEVLAELLSLDADAREDLRAAKIIS